MKALSLDGPPTNERDWNLDRWQADSTGRVLTDFELDRLCQTGGKQESVRCVESPGPTFHQGYQPAERFWTFGGIEAGIYLAASAMLQGVAAFFVLKRAR